MSKVQGSQRDEYPAKQGACHSGQSWRKGKACRSCQRTKAFNSGMNLINPGAAASAPTA
jgi:hypothetical protein